MATPAQDPLEATATVRRSWLIAAAGALGVFAILGFAGWVLQVPSLIQPFGGFPPFRPHFALGLAVAGLSLWGLATRRLKVAAVGAVVLVGLGLSATVGLMWDQFSMSSAEPRFGGDTGPAFARGLILVLAGLGVILTILAPRWATLWNIVGLAGVTLLALSVLMFIARILGLVRASDTAMSLLLGASPQMIVGAFILGVVFTRAAWRDVGFTRIPPAWVPWATGVGAVVALVLLWRALLLNEAADLRHLVQAAANAAAAHIAGPLARAVAMVDRVARSTSDPTRSEWRAETGSAGSTPIMGLMAIGFADTTGTITSVVDSARWIGSPDRALVERQLTAAGPATWPDRTPRYLPIARDRFAIAVPLYQADARTGFAVGLINLQAVLPTDIADSSRFGYRLSFGGDRVAGDELGPSGWVERVDIHTSTPSGRLDVWPHAATIGTLRSALPNVVFAFGLAVVILLPLSIQLARTAWDRARVIERGQLYAALERGTDGVWEMDLVNQSVRPSPVLWTHLGYDARSLPVPNAIWQERIHPEDRPRYQAALKANVMGKAEAFEAQYRFRAADGSWHWLADRGRVTERDTNGHANRMLGIIGDVTERHLVEEARQASEQRYRATFESAFQFQALLAPDGSCLDVNRTALSYGGITLDQVWGQPFWTTTWWQSSPETRARIEVACRAAARGATERLEVEAAGRDGAAVVLDLSIKPLLGSEGSVEQLLVEGRDLTERKRAEKLLREVEVLATMGRVAAKVAHEINNPLAGIQNSFLLIKDAIPPSHPHIRYVGAIEREIGRISAVTRQLYETFRPERNGSTEPLEVVIGDTVGLIRQLNRTADVHIITDFRKPLPEGAVPAAIIRQTVYNLVQNAVDASPPGGEIRVTTETVPGGHELRVRDQGPGVPAVVRERIFDPFYTTKPHSLRPGGMGLGLYLVRRSVEALGGTVRLVSPPEGGTEFVIWFPSYRSSIAGV